MLVRRPSSPAEKCSGLNHRKAQNTTISALISLRLIPTGQIRARTIDRMRVAGEHIPADLLNFNVDEKQPGGNCLEEYLCYTSISREICFCGGYDERFRAEGNTVACSLQVKIFLPMKSCLGWRLGAPAAI